MEERLSMIVRIMHELEQCEKDMHDHVCADPLMPLLGQMDWLSELHSRLYISKQGA